MAAVREAFVHGEMTGVRGEHAPRLVEAEPLHARHGALALEQHGLEELHALAPRANTAAARSSMASVQVSAMRKCPRWWNTGAGSTSTPSAARRSAQAQSSPPGVRG